MSYSEDVNQGQAGWGTEVLNEQDFDLTVILEIQNAFIEKVMQKLLL